MIPVGTLCEIVQAPPVAPELIGLFCTVSSHHTDSDGAWHVLAIPARPFDVGLDAWCCLQECLRVIVPPGDPDAEPHDVSEPELLEVFR